MSKKRELRLLPQDIHGRLMALFGRNTILKRLAGAPLSNNGIFVIERVLKGSIPQDYADNTLMPYTESGDLEAIRDWVRARIAYRELLRDFKRWAYSDDPQHTVRDVAQQLIRMNPTTYADDLLLELSEDLLATPVGGGNEFTLAQRVLEISGYKKDELAALLVLPTTVRTFDEEKQLQDAMKQLDGVHDDAFGKMLRQYKFLLELSSKINDF